jgi:hypothetical protein
MRRRTGPTFCNKVRATLISSMLRAVSSKGARGRPAIAQRMVLARPAATRQADRLEAGPLFPPTAERGALMWVPSIMARPWIGLCPLRAPKIPSHRPCRLQRLKPVVDRRVRAVNRGPVPPASARAQKNTDDAADDPVIIDTVRPATASRHQRLSGCPLCLAQKIFALPSPQPFGSLNHIVSIFFIRGRAPTTSPAAPESQATDKTQ